MWKEPVEKGREGKRDHTPREDFFFFLPDRVASFPTFLFYGPELSHVATPTCLGSWERESSHFPRKKGLA